MKTIFSLPTEILLTIFRYFTLPDLARVAQVDRRFRKLGKEAEKKFHFGILLSRTSLDWLKKCQECQDCWWFNNIQVLALNHCELEDKDIKLLQNYKMKQVVISNCDLRKVSAKVLGNMASSLTCLSIDGWQDTINSEQLLELFSTNKEVNFEHFQNLIIIM